MNKYEHIIAHGFSSAATCLHAFPRSCELDYNGDYLVDNTDLGLFLSAGCTAGCVEDINQDGVVDSGDLGLLLVDWHDETEGEPCAVRTTASCRALRPR